VAGLRTAPPARLFRVEVKRQIPRVAWAARAFDEGSHQRPDGDVGSILGWGFAPWTGGVFSYIDGIGARRFVDECAALAAAHGPLYAPPGLLVDMAREGRRFHEA
jgi:3-hydroxyacyl-CoA dehydrogenase/enoyl-CoA hydratase/3-hydroxybutyryl-CoA epimerase